MDELQHHGIQGQKWGVRRWQNPDGTYTEAGKARYFNSDGTLNRAGQKFEARMQKKDLRWVGKNEGKIIGKVERSVKRDIRQVDRELRSKYRKQFSGGKPGFQYMFEHNSRVADAVAWGNRATVNFGCSKAVWRRYSV